MRPALFLCLLALASCGSEPGNAPDPRPAEGSAVTAAGRLDRSQAGSAAPEIEFEGPGGDRVSLADFAGKPVLLNLWATWCAPCVAEMPTLDALAAREQGLHVLAVSEDIQGREKVDAFFDQHGYSALEPFLDQEMQLMSALKVQSLPATILYDSKGREVWRMTGAEDWQGPRAAALLAEAKR